MTTRCGLGGRAVAGLAVVLGVGHVVGVVKVAQQAPEYL